MKEIKKYVRPETQVIEAEPTNLLAESPGQSGTDENPGENYGEIEVGEGYRKEFD